MNILILGVGGPTPRSIAKRLRSVYPNANIIGTDISPKAIGFYIENLLDHKYIIPRASDPKYWNRVKSIIKDHKIDFAFVQPEREVVEWGRYLNENGEYPCPTLIPPVEHVEALMDKAAMADLLGDTDYIPKTVRITPQEPKLDIIEKEIGFPFWIRASIGSGGLGSLRINRKEELDAWLFIHQSVPEFTVSSFLTGRHLANQMLYKDGVCLRNAGLHCAEYVMADIAPSKVTGNTSYGVLLNEKPLLDRCEEIMDYVQRKTGVKANGVYSFDFKEDHKGNIMVTEINIRHMAYTGILAQCGFDLISDTVDILTNNISGDKPKQHFFDDDYIFLRDVDVEPLIMPKSKLK